MTLKVMKNVFFTALATVISFFGIKKMTSTTHKMKRIGHRGAAGYCPENTFPSYDRAIEMGADYLEIDVQLSKDGKIVVIHDSLVDRTTDHKGKVSDFTFDELRKMDAGSWFSQKFRGACIPSFEEVLDKYADRVGLLIELKKPALYPGIEKMIAEELKKKNFHTKGDDHIIVQSFETESMKRFHELLPEIPVAILINYPPDKIEIKNIAEYASYLNPKWTVVNKRVIDLIHSNGMKAIAWTVRSRKEAEKLKHYPLDGIVADYLDLIE
ncbi:glycerophosphodiester phosphodiesterase family protein [Cytobacillus oceanisediminis]|uniref:glycerophosphodiester phosphodiesterase n=1 Tax=Cytobacillus oceanisediminis TaxID=665099 RepID=UPI0023D9B410|nr:glycerophosphodiester phosphodiesterase family protein [Cytobacillus oceanisediminis]MDF2039408.1 glycerophosphodiester phosphodiesterase family protein [Cytobacillus oceanisediminis]